MLKPANPGNCVEAAVPPGDFPATPRLLIRASAGTGKTFQLSNRYLSLLRKHSPDRILAVTFTRKAAGEILDRILLRLAGAVLNDKERKALSGFIGGEELTAAECERLLSALVNQLHRVKVSTLDSFFSRLATSLSLEIGLPPNWAIADEHVSRSMTVEAIDEVLRSTSEVNARRLVHLLAKGVVPRSIARLIADTVETHYDIYRLTGAEAWRQISGSTLLSGPELDELLIELDQLDRSGSKALDKAVQKDLDKWRKDEWEDFLEKGPANAVLNGGSTYFKKELPTQVVDVYRRLVQQASGMLLKIWAEQIAAVHELLSAFSEARRRLVRESGDLQFDDIATALAERLRDVDSRCLVHRLDGDIDHLLLDEFQDTSLLQWDVLRPFVTALDSRREASFFCVGDVKQAIYGWRGGVAALFDRVQREFPAVQSGMLNESRRSAQAVMTAVNIVFQNLERHPNLGDMEDDVREWQRSFPEHTTAKQNEPGYVRLVTADGVSEGADARPGIGGKRDRCVGKAVDIVAELTSNRPDLTIGVLTRKNEMVGQVIHALAERGIPASEEGGVRLTTSAAVQLVQSLLRFADHPGDSIARFHVAHSPLGPLLGIRHPMSEAASQSAAREVRSELTGQGYEAAIERWSRALQPMCSTRDWARLRRLCVLAAEYDLDASLRPVDFAERIGNERVEEPTGSAVRVMTIHKSKGLEFDAVVLPDLEIDLHSSPKVCAGCPAPAERPDTVLTYRGGIHQQLLPPKIRGAINQQRRTDVHESLCNLYVAMTRAAHALYMVIAPQTPNEKGETTCARTAAGLLRATLSNRPDLPAATILFEHGSPRWWEELKPPAPAMTAAVATTCGTQLDPIALRPREGGRSRGRQAASPSETKSTRGVKAAHLLSLEAAAGMDRGTLWHLWCQQVKWLNESLPDRRRLLAIGRPHCRDAARLEIELDTFLSKLEDPEINAIFVPARVLAGRPDLGSELTVHCVLESRFSRIDEGRCQTGAIDRLILYRRGREPVGADVIDFKTDLTGPASRMRAAYCDQLRQYAAAVANTYGLDSSTVRCQLVWLSASRVECMKL